jgi:hypothetical protein
MHIGGTRSKDALEKAYAREKEGLLKESLEFAIKEIAVSMLEEEKQSGVVRVRPADIE